MRDRTDALLRVPSTRANSDMWPVLLTNHIRYWYDGHRCHILLLVRNGPVVKTIGENKRQEHKDRHVLVRRRAQPEPGEDLRLHVVLHEHLHNDA